MSRIRLTLLGTFRLEVDGRVCIVPTRKAEALLAYLTLRDHPHRRETLAQLLWGDVSPSQARHSLRQTLSRLRHLFHDVPGPVLVTEGEMVRMEPLLATVDVVQFRALTASERPEDLAFAASLYGGELLEGLQLNEARFDTWLASERAQLHHLATAALERQLQQAATAGRVERAIAIAVSMLALDQTQEHVHRTLMTLYRKQGRSGAALQQYNTCARILQEELGVEPDADTRMLCQEIIVDRARGHTRPAHAEASRGRGAHLGRGQTVLVVAPGPVTRALLERVLTRAGYTVVLGDDAGSVPPRFDVQSCAAVLADGSAARPRFELLSRLQQAGYAGPVFFIAANIPRGLGSAAGGIRVHYIRRPIHQRVLLESLREALGAAAGSEPLR
jgi:DNA-binding SARP family transcriptional activator